MRYAYPKPGNDGYGEVANAKQKPKMVVECLGGDLLPVADIGMDKTIVWILPVHGVNEILLAIKCRLFGIPYLMCTWDPPGITLYNRTDIKSKLRQKIQMLLYSLALTGSIGVILNLHPAFFEKKIPRCLMKKVHAFPNGCLYKRCADVVARTNKVKKRIAVSGIMCVDKGCFDVVEVFCRLYMRDPEWSLVWIGGGPEYDNVVKTFAEKKIPDSQLILPGIVPHEDSLAFISTAYVSLNMYHDVPSLRWNYVLKIPEFMSLGVPVVSVDVPGVREYVKSGVTGELVPCSQNEKFVEAIEKIAALSVDDYATMVETCRKTGAQYDWDIVNSKIAAEITAMVN